MTSLRHLVAAAAASAVLAAAYPAHAVDTKWPNNQNANTFRLYNLPAPGSGTDAMRLQDVAVGAGWLKSSALNGTIAANATIPGTDVSLTATQVGFGSASNTLAGAVNYKINGVVYNVDQKELQIYTPTGSGAWAGFRLGSDAAFANQFSFVFTGTTFPGAPGASAALAELFTATPKPLVFSNYTDGDIQFATGSARTARMIVKGDGKVGVGPGTTPSASTLFHVQQDQNTGTYSMVSNGSTGNQAHAALIVGANNTVGVAPYMQLINYGTGHTGGGIVAAGTGGLYHVAGAASQSMVYVAYGAQDMIWATTTSQTERMRLKNDGPLIFPTTDAGDVSMKFTKAGIQKIQKTGGPFRIGSGDSNALVLQTNDTDRLTVNATGTVQLSSLTAFPSGYVRADSTGLLTSSETVSVFDAAGLSGQGEVAYGNPVGRLTGQTDFAFNSTNKTLAIGLTAASAAATSRIHTKANINGESGLYLENASAGTAAYGALVFKNNVPRAGYLYFTSSGYTGSEAPINSLVLSTEAAGGGVYVNPKNVKSMGWDGTGNTLLPMAGDQKIDKSGSGNLTLDATGGGNIAVQTQYLILPRGADQLIEKRTAGTLFIGTAVNVPMGFYTNNLERLDIYSNGEVRWDNMKSVSYTSANFPGLTTTNPTVFEYAITPPTTATAAALPAVHAWDAVTLNLTGTTTTANTRNVAFFRPTITNPSAHTSTKASTVWIENAPTASGSETITNAYALDVEDGRVRIGGDFVALARAGTQNIEKQGTSAFFIGTLAGQDLGLYTNNTTRHLYKPDGSSHFFQTPNFTVASGTEVAPANPTVVEWQLIPPATASAATVGPLHRWDPVTLTLTGTTTVTGNDLALAKFFAPFINDSSAVTVNTAATVAISGAPIASGSVTFGSSLAKALHVQSGFTSLDGAVAVNGVIPPTNVAFLAGHTTESARDRVQLFLGGGGSPDSNTENTFFRLFMSNTTVPAGQTTGVWSVQRIGTHTLTGTSTPTISEATTLRVDGAPTLATLTTTELEPYALHVAGGMSRFDGDMSWNKAGGVNYERVVGTFISTYTYGSNFWVLQAQRGGTGAQQNLSLDAQNGQSIIAGSSATGMFTNTSGISIIGTAGSEMNSYHSQFTRASSANMVLDAHRFTTPVFITGTTAITTATGVNAVRFHRPVYDGNFQAKTVTNAATVYIENSPNPTNSLTITNAYSLWVDDGLVRFDGNGTHIFELPTNATAGVDTTIDGRIPIKVGGVTKYIRYYSD